MFTHKKLKDVDTIISRCVRSRTNDGNYLKSFWQSMQKTGGEVKTKKKKNRKAIAELIAFHANAIIVTIITVTVVILMMLLKLIKRRSV